MNNLNHTPKRHSSIAVSFILLTNCNQSNANHIVQILAVKSEKLNEISSVVSYKLQSFHRAKSDAIVKRWASLNWRVRICRDRVREKSVAEHCEWLIKSSKIVENRQSNSNRHTVDRDSERSRSLASSKHRIVSSTLNSVIWTVLIEIAFSRSECSCGVDRRS